MTLGTILGASFQVMRRNPRTTLVPGLIIARAARRRHRGRAHAPRRRDRAHRARGHRRRTRRARRRQPRGRPPRGAGRRAPPWSVATARAAGAHRDRGRARHRRREADVSARSWARGRRPHRRGHRLHALLLLAAIVVHLLLFFGIIVAIAVATTANSSVGHRHPPRASSAWMFAALRRRSARLRWAAACCGSGSSTKLAFVPAAIVLERLPIRCRDRALVEADARLLLAHPRHPAAGLGDGLVRDPDRVVPDLAGRLARRHAVLIPTGGIDGRPDRRRRTGCHRADRYRGRRLGRVRHRHGAAVGDRVAALPRPADAQGGPRPRAEPLRRGAADRRRRARPVPAALAGIAPAAS